jgi:hypothetical protein
MQAVLGDAYALQQPGDLLAGQRFRVGSREFNACTSQRRCRVTQDCRPHLEARNRCHVKRELRQQCKPTRRLRERCNTFKEARQRCANVQKLAQKCGPVVDKVRTCRNIPKMRVACSQTPQTRCSTECSRVCS